MLTLGAFLLLYIFFLIIFVLHERTLISSKWPPSLSLRLIRLCCRSVPLPMCPCAGEPIVIIARHNAACTPTTPHRTSLFVMACHTHATLGTQQHSTVVLVILVLISFDYSIHGVGAMDDDDSTGQPYDDEHTTMRWRCCDVRYAMVAEGH